MKPFNVSSEFVFKRFGNGVCFAPPSTDKNEDVCLAEVLRHSFNVCFLGFQSKIIRFNDTCAEACGVMSIHDLVGKTALEFTHPSDAEKLFINDQQVIKTNKIHVFEETFTRNKDGEFIQFISVKAPWYNQNHRLLGIFNCAIALGLHDLTSSLMMMNKLGLFTHHDPTHNMQHIFFNSFGDIQLTPRETQCLIHYVRGKSAKQIGILLNLSFRTVEHYLEKIKRKMRVTTKSELIEKTIEIIFAQKYIESSSDNYHNCRVPEAQ